MVTMMKRTVRLEDALGRTVRVERGGFGGATLATTCAYDGLGRLVRVAADGEPAVSYAYGAAGERVSTTRSVGPEWRRTETDSRYALVDGEVWRVTTNRVSCSDAAVPPLVTSSAVRLTGLTAANPSRRVAVDARGNATEEWTAFAEGTLSEFRRVPGASNAAETRLRLGAEVLSVSASSVTNATAYGRGNVSRVEYDGFGRRSATVDAAGNATRYGDDAYGNLAAVTNALGGVTVYGYDLRGNRTYEGGATYPVRREYDVFGNVTSMTTYRDGVSGAGDVTRWAYDAATGAVTGKTYADGRGPSYEYDANGRLARRTWARGAVTDYAYDGWGNLTNTAYSDGTPSVALRYDAMGRLTGARDAAGLTAFAYDAFGAVTNEVQNGKALARFYDRFGRSVGYALNGERRTTVGWDAATGRIVSMRVAGCGDEFSWTYLPGTDLKSTLRYPNGDLVTWEYERHRNLVNLVSNDTYSTFAYGYDALGRRTAKNDERYFHNVRGELVLATNVATGAEFAYRYDDIGNRIWSRELGTNCMYAANELNQYTDVVRGGVAERLAFDPDGNQTNVVTGTGVWAVEYNGENRPVRWTRLSDGNSISMAYDRMGRRISKNGETFVYDGYLNVGNTVWDPTEPVATRPLVSCGDDGTVAYLFHDGNKNVVDEVWPEELKSVTYEPFGKCLELDYSRVTTPWRYSSEYDDSLLGLLYYNSRFLNSRIGRWNSGDAIGEMGGENLYCFCLNSPEDKTDSLGFQSNCTESELTTTLGWEFNVGFGSIAISYNNRLRQRDCRVCCPDGSMGQTITKEYSNGGGGGGSWKVLIGPIPIQIGFSYQVSGGSVEVSDSCSVSRTFNGCKTVSMSLFAGPSVSISGVGIAILGDLTISSTSCLGKDEIPQAISGKLVFQLCYWPGNCQTKDLYP